jgi:hypothetical protein
LDYQFQVNSKQTNICISGAAGLILGHPFDTTKVKKTPKTTTWCEILCLLKRTHFIWMTINWKNRQNRIKYTKTCTKIRKYIHVCFWDENIWMFIV